MFMRGMRTWSNPRNPLSMAVKPIFGPMSPTVTPGRGWVIELARLFFKTKANKVVLHIANLHQKREWSIVFAVDEKASNYK